MPIAACIVLGVMFMRAKGANENYFNGYIIFIGIFNVDFSYINTLWARGWIFVCVTRLDVSAMFRVICVLYMLNNTRGEQEGR